MNVVYCPFDALQIFHVFDCLLSEKMVEVATEKCCYNSPWFQHLFSLSLWESFLFGFSLRVSSDRQLTTNFELWVEIFCVPTCFHVRIPKPCLSVCPYPEKRNHLSFVNISPTLVIDTSMERSSRALQHGNQNNMIFLRKNAYLSVSAVMFCKQFLAYAVRMGWSAFLCNP